MAEYPQHHPFFIISEAARFRSIDAFTRRPSWWRALGWSWGWYTGWPFPWLCKVFGHKWNGWGRCDRCWAFRDKHHTQQEGQDDER